MQIKIPMVMREVMGDHVLVPVGEGALTLNGLVTVNEVGAFLWERLADAPDADALTDAVTASYDVDRAQAAADVEAFLKRLREIGIL